MNQDSLSISLSQISFLIANLGKKNFKQTSQELSELVCIHGLEAENQVLRCLLTEAAKTTWDNDRPNASSSSNSSVHASLLAQYLTSLLNHPARSTVVCCTVDQPTRTVQKIIKPANSLLSRLTRLLKLTTAEDVAFSLVLRNSSKPDVVNFAKQHLKKRFLDLVQCYLDAERSNHAERAGLQECTPEVLQVLLSSLTFDNFRLAPVTKDLFLKRLRIDFPRQLVPIILAPLLYRDDTEYPLTEMTTADDMAAAMMDNTLADIIRDIGFSFTNSVEECKNNMLNFGAREPTAIDVARIISMMVRYHATVPDGPPIQTPGNFWMSHEPKKDPTHGHTDTWNAEVFVQTLKELASSLNWKEVILQLDHPEFIVPDRQGLMLLFTILRLGLQSAGYPANIFPVEYLCRRWTNLEGQMSLISNILKYSDIFSFADHPFHPVAIDILKSPPETDNKEIATWRCLYLVELLLYAADRGFYMQVHDLFKLPVKHCPDILLLVLLQISPPITVVRQELITTLIPIFLGNHPNSGIILHQAWHSQNPNIKPIIMHAMADWYIRGESDQSKLSRILDVAQDLKALSLLLNVQSFPFVIDLACLASRREYLKLDKWLADKIRDHGETFISAMVKFLQRRSPQVMGCKMPEEPLPKAAQLPPETIATMLACLQLCINNVQPELSDAICSVITTCQTFMLSKTRQAMAGIARPHRIMETPFAPSGLNGPVFTPHNIDPIVNLTPNVANMSLGAPTNTAFAMPGSLGPLVSTPGSPSRLMGAGPNSPFALMPMQHAPGVGNMSALARMAPPTMDKPRIQDPLHYSDLQHASVSKEIEDEANGYFQRIYNHPPHPTLSIDEVLDMLKKFQDSPNKREREVYACMLRNLFEEYKFFPQYPDKELHITAQLFGGIIEKGLVPSYVSLGLALRFVLDALRKPEGSKMYYFGIAALDRFKSRLKDYHKYCEHVRAIPHFSEFPPHLIEYIEYGLQSQEPPTKPQGPVLPTSLTTMITQNAVLNVSAPYRTIVCTPSITVISKMAPATGGMGSRPSIANATNIDTLLTATDREEKISAPPEAIQDKTAFIFNNLSQLNLRTKCEELKQIITEEYHPWLSQYLVMKRASIELNFHVLYSNFLDVLKVREVNKMVTKEAYRNIKVLLRSDKGIANFSDRSLLKNLGHWLGMLTLARNVPILYIDLDLKGLVLEAYHKGQQELLYVVPFVAKVLESCAKSIVFRPPNPWTMALMNVLAELHQEPDLKLNLKFEIEVLCKNLGLEIGDVKPALYLKDPDKVRQIDFQLSQPKPKEAAAMPVNQQQQIALPAQMTMMPPQGAMMAPEDMPPPVVAPNNLVPTDPSLMGVNCPVNVPEPRFSYLDVNVNSTSAFGQKIMLNPHIILFQNYPHLKQFVKPAIERSIQEWIHPVVDRSIKYALTTCEQIIRKDFALDCDEVRMRTCAHHLMRNLTAGMAMITCREQIISTISANLKAAFLSAQLPISAQQNYFQEIIEPAAAVLATENMELACAFIQKTAVEKALPELDKRLMSDYELRKLAKQEGRRYFDPLVLQYQTERIPERVRLRVGGPTDTQMYVYEEFACNIPGFMPVRDVGMLMPKPAAPEAIPQLFSQVMNQTQMYGADEMGALITAAEMFLSNTVPVGTFASQVTNVHALMECLIITRRNRDPISGCTLLQKAVEGLLDSHYPPGLSSDALEVMSRYRDIHMRVLKLLEDARVYGHVWTSKQITCCLLECREELRYNLEMVDFLIKNHLVNLPQYDMALALLMDNGNNYMAVAYCMQLVQLYLVDDRSNIYVNEPDLFHVTDTLIRISTLPRQAPVPDGLAGLIEMLRMNQDPNTYLGERSPLGPTAHIHSGILQVRARDYDDDPPGLAEKTENLLREWRNVLLSPLTEIEISQNFNIYVHRMNMNGILKSDEIITRFFRIATQMCIENVYQQLNEDRINPPSMIPKRDKYYVMCDSFIKLVTLLIKNTTDNGNPTPKLNLLNKILGIIAGCLLQDHEEHGVNFQQMPYQKMFLILFLDMNNMAEPILDNMNFQVLTAFCHTLRIIRPNVAPGFSYAWLELVAHRAFINRVLAVTPQQKAWRMYSTLLVDLFKYLDPFLRNTELAPPVMVLYKGTLKVLLVLLHDFPEFLCDYHYGFCDEIPPNCIQMRNLILSAFPRNMRLPDPFTPNLKVDLLAEIALPPRAVISYTTIIPSVQFKKDLDAYLKARAPVTFLSELRSHMQVLNDPSRRYNSQLMNAVVLYVGTQAIAYIRSKGQTPNMSTIAHSAHMDIFQNFTVDFDYEGRYLFLNAIANQLRYPNSHTHYFSCCLLYLFAEANSEAVQEQITRMLLERLIVNRPHPWGLLITFIELIKNPLYKFWSHEFVHCAPEIEKLFASVARSCIADKPGGGGEREMGE